MKKSLFILLATLAITFVSCSSNPHHNHHESTSNSCYDQSYDEVNEHCHTPRNNYRHSRCCRNWD